MLYQVELAICIALDLNQQPPIACRAAASGRALASVTGIEPVLPVRETGVLAAIRHRQKNETALECRSREFPKRALERARSMRVGLLRVSACLGRSRWNRTIRSADMSRDRAPAPTAFSCACQTHAAAESLERKVPRARVWKPRLGFIPNEGSAVRRRRTRKWVRLESNQTAFACRASTSGRARASMQGIEP